MRRGISFALGGGGSDVDGVSEVGDGAYGLCGTGKACGCGGGGPSYCAAVVVVLVGGGGGSTCCGVDVGPGKAYAPGRGFA